MLSPSDHEPEFSTSTDLPDTVAQASATTEPTHGDAPAGEPAFADTMHARLAEQIKRAVESEDPVAELDATMDDLAAELAQSRSPGESYATADESTNEIGNAVGTLVDIALQMDDPVAALDDGADSLAEALAIRDVARREWMRATRDRLTDEQAACHHARLHRVGELMDVGYGLDQAIAITNANEADIRARALATGRNPMEPIYQYAVLNGYRRSRQPLTRSMDDRAPWTMGRSSVDDDSPAIEALTQMSDRDFAEATRGDKWRKLMRG